MSMSLETVGRDNLKELCLSGKFSFEYLDAVKQLQEEEVAFRAKANQDLFSAMEAFPYDRETFKTLSQMEKFRYLNDTVEILELCSSSLVIVECQCDMRSGHFTVSWRGKTVVLRYDREKYPAMELEPSKHLENYPSDWFSNDDEEQEFSDVLQNSSVWQNNELWGLGNS